MEVIKIKKSFNKLLNNVLSDVISIIKSSYITMFIVLFPIIYTFENISKLEMFFANESKIFILSALFSILGMFLINSGMLVARKVKTRDEVKTLDIIAESLMWIGIYIRFNIIKSMSSFLIIAGLIYSNYLNNYLIKPWEISSLMGILFIVLSGVTSRTLPYIYMSNDGVVFKKVKNVDRVSSSLTIKRVADYKKLDGITNFGVNKLFFIISSILVLFMSYSGLILPFILLLAGIVSYLIYDYSYEKITIDSKNNQEIPLVMGLKTELEIDDELVDNSITEVKKIQKNKLIKTSGTGNLSKEKILGEHWYLKDKPSIIKEDEPEEDEDKI